VKLTPTASADPGDTAITELEGFAAVAKSVKRGRIDFICSHCNKRLAAQLASAGKTVTCPSCRTTLKVPAMEDGASPPPPADGASVFDDEPKLTSAPAAAAPVRGARVLRAEDMAPVDLSGGAKRATAAPVVAGRNGNGNGNGGDKPKRSRVATIGLFVGGVIVTAAISLAAIHFLTADPSGDGGDGGVDQPGHVENDPIADPVSDPDPGTGTGVEITGDRPGPGGEDLPPADTGGADVELVAAYRDLFANAGYLPAMLGREYVKVTVSIAPTGKGVAFNTYGKAVTLTIGETAHEALGALSGCSVFPLTGERMPAGISAGQTRKVMFLFDLPEGAIGDEPVTLKIDRVGEVAFRMPPAKDAPDATALVGEYVEAFPRNLKPMARSPILSAIEGYPNHAMTLRESADGLQLKMAGIGVVGTLTPDGTGYAATLQQRDRTLEATARVADGGKRIVLLFGDDATSRLTFVRAGDVQMMLLLPLLNDNDREPWALGKPKPIETTPTETQPQPGQPQPYRPPTGGHRPTTIFDF
jgi:hypothetical protein